MGLFSRSPPKQPGVLELFNPPLGIDLSFCLEQETLLIIKVCLISSLPNSVPRHQLLSGRELGSEGRVLLASVLTDCVAHRWSI